MERWHLSSLRESQFTMEERLTRFDAHMLKMQKHFRVRYRANVYILNAAVLQI